MGKSSRKKKPGLSIQEQQRRQAQAQAAQKPVQRIKTATDFIDGFCGDIINLNQQATSLRALLRARIDMAEKLVEANPLKFNVLRIDSLKAVQKTLEPLSEACKKLMVFVGKLEDLQTFAEKMEFATEHLDEVINATYLFDSVARNLQEVDAKFNQHLQSIVNPKPAPDSESGSAFEGHIGTAEFNMRYHSTVCEPAGTMIAPFIEFEGTDTSIHRVTLNLGNLDFFYLEDPYIADVSSPDDPRTIEVAGTIDQLNAIFKKGDYTYKVGATPGSFTIIAEGLSPVTVEVLPAMTKERNEDVSVVVTEEEAKELGVDLSEEKLPEPPAEVEIDVDAPNVEIQQIAQEEVVNPPASQIKVESEVDTEYAPTNVKVEEAPVSSVVPGLDNYGN